MMNGLYRDCPECGQERVFEQPHPVACPDVPDGICPEWACTVCGTALIMALLPDLPVASAPAGEQVRAA